MTWRQKLTSWYIFRFIVISIWSDIGQCSKVITLTKVTTNRFEFEKKYMKVDKLSHAEYLVRRLRKWLVAYSVQSHYQNLCCVIVNWNIKNKLHQNFYQNTKIFIDENASENVVCKMAAILSRGDELNLPDIGCQWGTEYTYALGSQH